jgi:polyhydroxybutyrate depolymerase
MKLILLILLFSAAVAAAIRALTARRRRPAPLGRAPLGQLVSQRVRFAGMDRGFLIYVPSGYSAGRPLPLVLAFHGGGGTAVRMAAQTRMHDLAREEEFIAVYPEGTGFGRRRGGTWNAGGNPPQGWAERHGIDDVGYVRRLIALLSGLYAIDGKKIYAVGVSKGGMLAYHLACQLSDTIAAVGVVAGTMTGTECRPRNPVAVMHVHGTADQNVPFDGGRGARTARGANWPPVSHGLAYWCRHNGCVATPRLVHQRGPVKCWQYDAPDSGADVRFCLIDGGGHSWPGALDRRGKRHGKLVVESFCATRELWGFFVEHPKVSE